jgi:hypothetical protein
MVTEEIVADELFTSPHQRAEAKPRQEGFEPYGEEAEDYAIAASEYRASSSDIHRDTRGRAAGIDKQTGVPIFIYYMFHELPPKKYFSWEENYIPFDILRDMLEIFFLGAM